MRQETSMAMIANMHYEIADLYKSMIRHADNCISKGINVQYFKEAREVYEKNRIECIKSASEITLSITKNKS